MKISVVVPTYNRKELLWQLILSLQGQMLPPEEFEVVVADDGSDDGTAELVKGARASFPIHYTCQENQGPAAARNLGAQQARGAFILFLDVDMEATPTLLEEHLESHRQHPDVLVRGRFKLPPGAMQAPFAAFQENQTLETDGDGFLSPLHCATGNLSLGREAFHRIGGFDERFFNPRAGLYAWDDVDLGYRASRLGLRLLYNPAALSFHHDYAVTLQAAGERARRAARSVQVLFDKHPELQGQLAMFEDKGYIDWRHDRGYIIRRKLVRSIMILSPVRWLLETVTKTIERLYPSPSLLRPLYRWVLGTYICLGYREGLKARHD